MSSVFDHAASRVSYRLTFAKTSAPRAWSPDELSGPDIPDAYRDGEQSSGYWAQEEPYDTEDPEVTEQEWLDHYLSMAVNEAVHEVLEWFRVDDHCYLDPHGEHEPAIFAAVNACAAQLAALAGRHNGRSARPSSSNCGRACDRAAERITYQLTYAATRTPRECYPDSILGPDIPNARQDGTLASGEWQYAMVYDTVDDHVTESQWHNHFLCMAVNEAVHEVLEWFRVDDVRYLDPHGERLEAIANAATELAFVLADSALSAAVDEACDGRPGAAPEQPRREHCRACRVITAGPWSQAR